MITPFKDYDATKTYTDYARLPKGAYELIILGVTLQNGNNGQYIELWCDVAKGDYNGYFTDEYERSSDYTDHPKWHCKYLLNIPKDDGSEKDGWTKRRFKSVIEDIEESNPGFKWTWDEALLKHKKVGGLFNYREFKANDGTTKQAINLKQLISVDRINAGKYKLPEDDLLKEEQKPSRPDPSGFTPASSNIALPF